MRAIQGDVYHNSTLVSGGDSQVVCKASAATSDRISRSRLSPPSGERRAGGWGAAEIPSEEGTAHTHRCWVHALTTHCSGRWTAAVCSSVAQSEVGGSAAPAADAWPFGCETQRGGQYATLARYTAKVFCPSL